MTESELDQILYTHTAPAPAPDLADRILASAKAQTPANDTPARKPLWRAAIGVAAAAVIGVGVFTTFSSPAQDDTVWEQQADNTGFGELYAWTLADEEG